MNQELCSADLHLYGQPTPCDRFAGHIGLHGSEQWGPRVTWVDSIESARSAA